MMPNLIQYIEEKKKWKEAGKPVRGVQRIHELYNICKQCEHFLKLTSNTGQCKICTCFLRQNSTNKNKLAFATTRCPLEKPKWVEEEGTQTEEAAIMDEPQSQPQQFIQRPKRQTNDCGCS